MVKTGGLLPPQFCITTGGSARDVTHSITSIIQSFVNKCVIIVTVANCINLC